MVLCLNIYSFYMSAASQNASAAKVQSPDLGLNIRWLNNNWMQKKGFGTNQG